MTTEVDQNDIVETNQHEETPSSSGGSSHRMRRKVHRRYKPKRGSRGRYPAKKGHTCNIINDLNDEIKYNRQSFDAIDQSISIGTLVVKRMFRYTKDGKFDGDAIRRLKRAVNGSPVYKFSSYISLKALKKISPEFAELLDKNMRWYKLREDTIDYQLIEQNEALFFIKLRDANFYDPCQVGHEQIEKAIANYCDSILGEHSIKYGQHTLKNISFKQYFDLYEALSKPSTALKIPYTLGYLCVDDRFYKSTFFVPYRLDNDSVELLFSYTENVKDHQGLVGGKKDIADADEFETGLREFKEETGVDLSQYVDKIKETATYYRNYHHHKDTYDAFYFIPAEEFKEEKLFDDEWVDAQPERYNKLYRPQEDIVKELNQYREEKQKEKFEKLASQYHQDVMSKLVYLSKIPNVTSRRSYRSSILRKATRLLLKQKHS